MPPKSKKKEASPVATKSKSKKEIVKDDRFQAIVLTDSFQTRFMPLTAVKPRCLLPLANVPLIEYTLEFLAQAGVNEVYLMCSSHADQIQTYIENSKWSQSKNSPFHIATIMSLESRSVGDAMRDLDNRGLISGDFLLVSGDVVTNMDFSKCLNFHRAKKSSDKDHMVTMVLNQASPLHRTRSYIEPATFILDKKTDRCLYYQGIPSVDGKKTSINIDPELLEDIEDEFVIRNDLIDCHVDICSPQVPQIFQENFDYQTLRSDFVKGVLTSDLLKKTIYAYITEDSSEYVARVESWGTYDAVSQDILARWCYPIVPDSNLIEDNSYNYEFNNIYKEDKVILAQSCKIGTSTSIGTKTVVGEGTCIKKSVVGRNCKIGDNVIINNSYIWDNAVIKDNSVLEHTIVAANAEIGANVTLNPGSVIGFNVIIGDNKVIGNNVRIVESQIVREGDDFNNSFSDSEDEEEHAKPAVVIPDFAVEDIDLVGEQGKGFMYVSDREEDEDFDESESVADSYSGMIYQMKHLNVSDESIASISNRRTKRRSHSRNRRYSANSMISDGGFITDDDGEEEDFTKEGVATVARAIENNHDIDTALLELNTLRMSMNVTYHEVRSVTVQALLNKIVEFVSTDTLKPQEAGTKIFNHWGPMFTRQVFSSEEQVDLLNILEDKIEQLSSSYNQVILFLAVKTLYDLDITEEENILEWWDAKGDEAEVRQLTSKFITWLQEADEEEDTDSDSDEE
ncbi:translation initiation factor eIF-2B epsilon subunit [Spathaspora passalidarum NRRL Y-27907]|uniref:Translation initiation factor eIF2B subunit epsilon n=1 Tax=Spathaspora passalidarum (strain NRRL Y-27907 / 11-Y1) TaxID=619300 RepID=G3ATD3_SPAPN|nr:translation initiation factor eIF-2B epsilon subunit [Spathaspora passalidarum NRRL Y-27907]EGW30896.1 translation initiation factor eIF-2B epsilon subunit [Spathaspora passalidarum NRRL Y-27907]